MREDFLGSGWGFPLSLDAQGQFVVASHEQSIAESIQTILCTAPGERLMLPDFGCGIHRLVFAPATAATITQAIDHVRRALTRWEPRITLLNVTAAHERDDQGISWLLIEIDYRVRTTNNRFNLVYPFYLEQFAMASQAPPIDPRSYDDIVEQTEKLAYQLSGWQPASRTLVPAVPKRLCGSILDEDLRTAALVALRGTLLDQALAERIAAILPRRRISVRYAVQTNAPMSAGATLLGELVGETLDEDVIAVDGTVIATSGAQIDAALARAIAARRKYALVRVTAPSDAATLNGLVLDDDISSSAVVARRNTLINEGLAARLSAALDGATVRALASPADIAARQGLTLREDVYSATLIAGQDTLITDELAAQITQVRAGRDVRVRQLSALASSEAIATGLSGRVLDEDVIGLERVASAGSEIDAALAQVIVAAIAPGPVRLRAQVAAEPGRLCGMRLNQDIVDTGVAIGRGTLIDATTARRIGALRLPRAIWLQVRLLPAALPAYVVLEEPVLDERGMVIAVPGVVIAPELAARIAAVRIEPVQVLIPPLTHWLDGATLDQAAGGDAATQIPAGTELSYELAKNISTLQRAGLPEPTPALAAVPADHGLVWVRPSTLGGPDLGGALAGLFGRMMEGSIGRLNQALDKQRLAFLNMVGAAIEPPQPARVPLTFQLVKGRTGGGFVPARTRVLSRAGAGATQVSFETDQDLTVIDARLVAAIAHDPSADQAGDYTAVATGAADGSFPAFAGNAPVEHSLYLSNDDLLATPGAKDVTISFIAPSSAPALANTAWSYWDGARWKAIESGALSVRMPSGIQTDINITGIAALAPLTLAGHTGGWLRAQPLAGYDLSAVQLQGIYLTVTLAASAVVPARAFANTAPVDLTKDFYPFGERPHFNDTLYLSLPQDLAAQGTQVAIDVALTNGTDNTNPPIQVVQANGAQVTWEVWLGDGWRQIVVGAAPQATTTGRQVVEVFDSANSDTTNAFTQSGKVSFVLPAVPARLTLGGISGYWLRARLTAGDYGKDAWYQETSGAGAASPSAGGEKQDDPTNASTNTQPNSNSPSEPVYKLIPTSFAPPAIASLHLSYTNIQVAACSACLTSTAGAFADWTANAWAEVDHDSRGHATVFVTVNIDGSPMPTFAPFARADGQPALYLGFDQRFPNLPVTLFLDAVAPLAEQAVGSPASAPLRIVWEYATTASSTGWAPLGAEDETGGLTELGMLTFIGPADVTPGLLFGQTLYWLRARPEGEPAPDLRIGPQLGRVLTNTIWATQATTIAGETLGPSDGSPGQTFHTRSAPVLPGQRIEVFERDMTPDERASVLATEGADAITPARDASGQTTGAWVRWHEAPDFYASGPRDRHYCIDHTTGEVCFGDGQAGLIPPLGRQGVRAALYRTGGGAGGNCPAGTISQLTGPLPFIAGVSNLLPASGGVAAEFVKRATDRAARLLRHGGRAIAAEDYEDLALAASPEVARALAIPAGFTYGQRWLDGSAQADSASQALTAAGAGQVGLILVPWSTQPQPTPSMELIERVRRYIEERCPPTAHLWIGPPGWIDVAVAAEVAPVSLAAAEVLEADALAALRAFLHPLTGGRDGTGWPFGRAPYLSDIYALLESLPGVDHVGRLELHPLLEATDLTPGEHTLGSLPPDLRSHFLVCSGIHRITLIPRR